MRTTLLLLALLALAAGQGGRPADPEEVFVLEIDGAKHELIAGRTYEFDIHGRSSKVSLAPLPYRELRTRDFSFRFPRTFHYEYDDGEDVSGQASWTVEGPSTLIQLTRVIVKTEAAALDAWADALLAEGGRKSELKLRLGERELTGIRVENVTDPDMRSRSDLFAWKSNGQVWLVHIFDHPDADGAVSAELRPAYELFRKTFKQIK